MEHGKHMMKEKDMGKRGRDMMPESKMNPKRMRGAGGGETDMDAMHDLLHGLPLVERVATMNEMMEKKGMMD